MRSRGTLSLAAGQWSPYARVGRSVWTNARSRDVRGARTLNADISQLITTRAGESQVGSHAHNSQEKRRRPSAILVIGARRRCSADIALCKRRTDPLDAD